MTKRKLTKRTEEEEFEDQQKSSVLELWFLGVLFVIVIVGLFQLQKMQQDSHSEVAGQTDPTGISQNAEFTRNKTPALGL
ncbi:MAG: hypothetical protein HRT45_08370 [Bdellovibrionales bacterium]|nr:hypothetical protein [Bdellovibrionales bacterium]